MGYRKDKNLVLKAEEVPKSNFSEDVEDLLFYVSQTIPWLEYIITSVEECNYYKKTLKKLGPSITLRYTKSLKKILARLEKLKSEIEKYPNDIYIEDIQELEDILKKIAFWQKSLRSKLKANEEKHRGKNHEAGFGGDDNKSFWENFEKFISQKQQEFDNRFSEILEDDKITRACIKNKK